MKKLTLLFFAALLVLTMIVMGCKKDKDNNTPSTEPPVNVPLELWSNVKIIDPVSMELDSTASNFTAGTFVFNFIGTPELAAAGDIIVGSAGEGYIRKVTSVASGVGVVTYQTTQGTMEEVFKNGSIDFAVDLDDMSDGRSAGFSYSVSDVSLYNSGSLRVDLLSAGLTIDRGWDFHFNFNDSGIQLFQMSTEGASWHADAEVKVTASQPITLPTITDTLASYHKYFTQWVQVGSVSVPVVIKINMDWVAECSVAASSSVNSTTEVSSAGYFTLGMKYAQSQWQGLYGFTGFDADLISESPDNQLNAALKFAWRPVISTKIYGVGGPRASMGLMTDVTGTVSGSSLDWDLKAVTRVKSTTGANSTILGYITSAPADQTWETGSFTYRNPNQIQYTSGDNQSGNENEPLLQPCKVQILNSIGEPVKDVPVYFNTTSGGGSVSPTSVLTNADGYAQTVWTLGSDGSNQTMEASAKYGDLTTMSGAPVIFTAGGSCDFTNITDSRDGQVYKTIQIGTQTWFAENLNYAGGMTQVSGLQPSGVGQWAAVGSQPAWCYYEDDSQNGNTYGKLYNWYAANTSICPQGWHIPTRAEWNVLVNYLGGEDVAGGKLKANSNWAAPNEGATNESCFSALPGGYCGGTNGWFYTLGYRGEWWSSTGENATQAYTVNIDYGSAQVWANSYSDKTTGRSCRCVMD